MWEEPLKSGAPSLDVLMKPYYAAETETFVIPAGTSVSVAFPDGGRFDHTLKKEHRFHRSHKRYEEASDDYYYRFATDNEKYPHMFILKSLFERHADPFGGETIDPDDLGPEIPPKKPLTVRQVQRMRKKSKCPDCSHEYWDGGPCGGGSQNMRCKGCGSKFNVTPFGIDRI